ncbi:hypothetical protein ASE66_25540 [Bosea sp. Root483D1]|uniref:hypothetical protein n=1 Tax=Bosea sp. Root483D1 TaxID=1736544 RepID=UPI0007102FEF|nr:hypothetical protein [Bosea sp. Root483D1]KRE22557.1 hypothetical protein ASE66_25540 [Bosea sp. Root483D1]
MATLNSVLATTEQHVGFPTSRTKQINRRLAEAAITPTGGPRRSPQLDVDDFLALLATSAMEDGLADVVSAHRRLFAMTPDGLPPTQNVPANLTKSAWEQLQTLADLALGSLEDQRQVIATNIEFVRAPVAEVIFHDRDGGSISFHESGRCRDHQLGHRKSTTVNGSALVRALRSLFN